MHKVVVTDGLVLSKRGAGESNTLLALLTQELGLVRASARSARKEVSKLRFGLEPMTTARFSLVRGRNEWKLIGVEAVSRTLLSDSSLRRVQVGRVTRLLLRLIHGEEPVPELYATIENGLRCLSETSDTLDAEAVECVLVLRILEHLGYLPGSPPLAPFLEGEVSSAQLIAKAKESRLLLIRTINESLSATGL